MDTETAFTLSTEGELWLVDDCPLELNLLSKVLEPIGYQLRTFDNPLTAIQAARKAIPDLMLLDVSMPEINGFDVCRQLKEDPQIADFPVIFVSGHEQLVARVRGFKVGGVDYLIKPVQRQELLARIHTHLTLHHMQRHLHTLVEERTHKLEQHSRSLERANDQLQKTLSRLEEAQKQVLQSEKLAAIGQLAAGVAHELNNPLGYIHSNLGCLETYAADLLRLLEGYEQLADQLPAEQIAPIQRLKREIDSDYLREDLPMLIEESKEGATRARQIIADLKDFSRSDQGERTRADLHAGLDSTLNIVHNELKYKADISKEYGNLPPIDCIPSQLNQVFLNLLVNAAQAIEERGTITLRTGVEGPWVWVDIQDTGAGIAPAALEKIFDPFYTTKPAGRGTGLGLSISASIIQRHGGRIDVDSQLGQGTRFRVWLPLDAPDSTTTD